MASTPSVKQHIAPWPSNGLWETALLPALDRGGEGEGIHPEVGIWGNSSQRRDEHRAAPCRTRSTEPSCPEEPKFGVSLFPLRSGISQEQRVFPTSQELILSGCCEGKQQRLLSLLMCWGKRGSAGWMHALHPCTLHPCTAVPEQRC